MPIDPGSALVTGAGRRLGRAMALDLAGRGWAVAIHVNGSVEDGEATAAEIRAAGGRAAVVQADLTEEAALRGLVARAAEAVGPPTLLVNNASIFEHDDLGTATRRSWDRAIESNLRAPVALMQDFAAQAPAAGAGPDGRPLARALVVNMIDQRVWKPTPEFFSYGVAKAGLWAATRMAAQGLAPAVRVNGIGPGPAMQGVRQSAEHFAAQQAATLLERGADAGAILGALRYLLEADSVTGQMIAVDGGQHLNWRTPDVLGVE